MAQGSAQARVYARRHQQQPQEEDYAEDDSGVAAAPEFDTALRMAHHAQRLKLLEGRVENFSHALGAFRAAETRSRRRQTIILAAVGATCLLASLVSAMAPRGAAAPHSQPVIAKAAPVMPAPQQVAAQQIQAPAPIAAPAPVYEAPETPVAAEPMPQPKPVALGRYQELPREREASSLPPVRSAPPPPRALTALEKSVAQHLASSGQSTPESWQPIFAREASGDSRAKLQIAAKFLKGEGVKPDASFAVTLIRQAANASNQEAMLWLAASFEAGSFGKPDAVSAARWYGEAAKAGNTSAYTELGRLYEKGVDGAPDPEMALNWYKRAAQSGDAKGTAAAERLSRTLASDRVLLSAAEPAPREAVNMNAAPAYVPPSPPMATPVAASAPPPPPPAPAFEGNNSAEAERGADIRAAQRMLKVLGYKIERADGALGPQTQNAIRAWQRDHAAYPDGQFTPELLESLTHDIRFGNP